MEAVSAAADLRRVSSGFPSMDATEGSSAGASSRSHARQHVAAGAYVRCTSLLSVPVHPILLTTSL